MRKQRGSMDLGEATYGVLRVAWAEQRTAVSADSEVAVGADEVEKSLAEVLPRAFGISGTVTRISAGTATDNFLVEGASGERWFAKVYPERSSLAEERAAIELAMFARTGGVPVPAVRPTVTGQCISRIGGLSMSLWEFVEGAETAEGGLVGERWATVGTVLGRLHRHLAGHPGGRPTERPAADLCDVPSAHLRYDRLIEVYQRCDSLDDDQSWALEAALIQRSLLPRVQTILESLPPLTAQIVHGDLAAPNLMMRGDDVAAVIDFQPPSAHFLAWEVARIGCDPRTVMSGEGWLTGLSHLLDAYREENPTAQSDLRAVVAVGCAYTLASTYPLGAPLQPPSVDHEGLIRYGRARHSAALRMLEALSDGVQ